MFRTIAHLLYHVHRTSLERGSRRKTNEKLVTGNYILDKENTITSLMKVVLSSSFPFSTTRVRGFLIFRSQMENENSLLMSAYISYFNHSTHSTWTTSYEVTCQAARLIGMFALKISKFLGLLK